MQERLEWLDNNGYLNEDGSVIFTRTTRFLMPLVGISEFSIEHINPKLLINAHCAETDDKLVYVILNRLDFPQESEDYLNIQNLNENFIDYIEEEQEYILIYKVPDHFNDDYNKILQGKYSMTSVPYKEVIIRVYGINRITNDYRPSIYDCLFPTEAKRQMYADRLGVDLKDIIEASSIPNLEYEKYQSMEQLKNKELGK